MHQNLCPAAQNALLSDRHAAPRPQLAPSGPLITASDYIDLTLKADTPDARLALYFLYKKQEVLA